MEKVMERVDWKTGLERENEREREREKGWSEDCKGCCRCPDRPRLHTDS